MLLQTLGALFVSQNSADGGRFTRMPVLVELSATVNVLLGKGPLVKLPG